MIQKGELSFYSNFYNMIKDNFFIYSITATTTAATATAEPTECLTLESANIVAPEFCLLCEGRVLSVEVKMHLAQTGIGHLMKNQSTEKIKKCVV